MQKVSIWAKAAVFAAARVGKFIRCTGSPCDNQVPENFFICRKGEPVHTLSDAMPVQRIPVTLQGVPDARSLWKIKSLCGHSYRTAISGPATVNIVSIRLEKA